jgi:hypothetical protein
MCLGNNNNPQQQQKNEPHATGKNTNSNAQTK